jgi:ATP-dependent helicase HrpA
LTREFVMRHVAANVTEELFPKTLEMAGVTLPLQYRFAPGDPWDGVTVTVPLALLNQIDVARLSWLVPGMVRDKVTAYLKALPKAWRSRVIPIAEVVTDFLSASSQDKSLEDALRDYLQLRLGDALSPDLFAVDALAPHLAFNVRVVDANRRELAEGRDVAELRARLGEAAQMSFAAAGQRFEKKGLTRWDFGDLPETLAIERNGIRIVGYPALIDEASSVSLALLDTRDAAESATRAGIIRLIHRELKAALSRFEKPPHEFTQAALELKTVVAADVLRADVQGAIVDRAFIGDDPLPRDEPGFNEQVKRARTRLPAVAQGAWRQLATIAHEHFALSQRLAAAPAVHARFAAELRTERDALVYPGFFSATPWGQLQHLPRYLRALERRYTRHLEAPGRDSRHAAQVAQWWTRCRERSEAERAKGPLSPKLAAFRWLLEELKVSLYAQELRTPFPVSFKRVEKAWADLSR